MRNIFFSKKISAALRLSVKIAFVFLVTINANADAPLLSLEVDSSTLNWQDEFVLKLSIYAPESMELPPITIDGMDQFRLQGTGKNLFQIPRGKTKRWVLTYTLIAADTGNFKVGPAVLMYEGRTYRSNIVFLNVEGPPARKQQAEPEKPPVEPPKKEKRPPAESPEKEKRPPAEPPKEEKKAPVEEPKPPQKQILKPPVITPAEIGDQILILMETRKQSPYQFQGIPVTVRLLSQLPVENLQFLEEADFPGFLRYDFPFTSKPKGEIILYKDKAYASYELVKFLLFPLEGGKIQIPAVRCELKVRVPSESFPGTDAKLNLERSSNRLTLQVRHSPDRAIVGDFVFRNEIVSDEPDSKVVRMILEGTGQLSTFDFPEIAGPQFVSRKLNVSTNANIQGESLFSRKIQELEILPGKSTTSVVLPEVVIREFDPDSASLSTLRLPPMRFQFQLPGAQPNIKPAFPNLTGTGVLWLFLVCGLFAGVVYFRSYRPSRKHKRLRLQRLFRRKNLKLQISRNAARGLYQQIMIEIAGQEKSTTSMIDALTRHLPQEEWLNVTRSLRKLERTAYSPTKPAEVTYAEMKQLCEKIESLWMQ